MSQLDSGGRRLARLRRAGDDEFSLVGEEHGLHAIAQIELLENVRDVRLRRVLAHHELRGDLLIRQPAGDEAEHFEFARGELVELGWRLAPSPLDELLDQAPGHRRSEHRATVRSYAYRGHEPVLRRVLEEEAARTSSERLVHVLVEVERR